MALGREPRPEKFPCSFLSSHPPGPARVAGLGWPRGSSWSSRPVPEQWGEGRCSGQRTLALGFPFETREEGGCRAAVRLSCCSRVSLGRLRPVLAASAVLRNWVEGALGVCAHPIPTHWSCLSRGGPHTPSPCLAFSWCSDTRQSVSPDAGLTFVPCCGALCVSLCPDDPGTAGGNQNKRFALCT